MDIRYLQSLVAVCKAGSIATAARQLNLTSAAVAARIKTLEEEIGTPLIKRAGRYSHPTEAGMRILEAADAMVRDARNIIAIANNPKQLGELRLGVATSTLAELTPDLLSRLYRAQPDLKVYIVSGASTLLYSRVVARELDAAIMVEPVQVAPKGFTWKLIRQEPLCVIAPVGLPTCDPHELLATQPFLRFDRSLRGGQIAETYLRRHRITPLERLEIDMLPTIAKLVCAGWGVSLIPDWSPQRLKSMDLLRLPLSDSTLARNMGLLWEESGRNAELVDVVLNEIQDIMRQNSADLGLHTRPNNQRSSIS